MAIIVIATIIVSSYLFIFQTSSSKSYPFWISNTEVKNNIDEKYLDYFNNLYMHFYYDGFTQIYGTSWYENSASWMNIGVIPYDAPYANYYFKYNYDTKEFEVREVKP